MRKKLLIIALLISWMNLDAQNVKDFIIIDYDGYSLEFEVTSVSPAKCMLSYCYGDIIDVVIPSTVIISGKTFSVTHIEDECFDFETDLISIEIPNTITSIGNYAFNGCQSLTNISLPNSVISIGDNAFMGCFDLSSITIPNSVTSIGKYAFSDCESLTNVNLPNSITTIQRGTFNCCYGLNSITIPSSVTSIEASVFYECVNLTSITIPNSVTSIGNYIFKNCYNLTSITLSNSITSIGHDAFYNCTSLTSISIPNSVTSIGEYAFSGCSALTSISIPNSVTSIEVSTFSSCSALTSISIPNSVTSIGDNAFYNCSSLTSISIPNSVTSIGNNVFYDCTSLTSISIPNSVTSIGEYAFSGCSGLKYIICLAKNIPSMGKKVFLYCPSDMVIYVPKASVESYRKAEQWKNFTIYSTNASPNNLIVDAKSPTSILLIWDLDIIATSYNIYQGNKVVAKAETNSYTFENLNCNTEYCFSVTAIRNGIESEKSEEACAKTLDYTITKPTNVIANPNSASSIVLTWNISENAMSYNIYRNDLFLTNVKNTSYTDSGLDCNTEYCYTVSAVRNETESEKTEEVCTKTFDLPISTPVNITANVISSSSVLLSWDIVNNALSYNIYYDDIILANVSDNSYIVKNLDENYEYCFTVTAIRNETESNKSKEVCAKTLSEGIKELTEEFNIYPNPVSDKLYIDTDADIEIYNINGQRINVQRTIINEQQSINVSNLQSGIYLVKIKLGSYEVIKKIVKQ